jgi:DNA-binding transcriptional LysR family regulator
MHSLLLFVLFYVSTGAIELNLSLRQIRYVCEVARLGSIRAACSSLHISQSSVLAAITLAEYELNATIFDRRPARGVQITPAGERFVLAARVFLEANMEFGRMVNGLSKGAPQSLRIGCFQPFGSLFLAELLKQYSDAVGHISIQLFEGDQNQLYGWLNTGTVDLVVTYNIGTSFGSDAHTPICKVPPHAILSPNNPLAQQAQISIADLAKYPLVLLDLPQTSTYLMTLFEVLADRPKISLTTRSYETVRSAVAAGFGVSILNMRPTSHAMADGPHLVRRALTDDFPAPHLVVADIYGPSKPQFVKILIQMVRQYFLNLGPTGFALTTPERSKGLFDFSKS